MKPRFTIKHLAFALMASVTACGQSDAQKHSEMAQGLLTQRGAPDFTDASTSERAAIRHDPSGMICVLPADGAFEFDVFPADATNEGAHCSGTVGEVANAWVAVRFQQATTLDAAFATAVNEITSAPDAAAWDGRPSAADRAPPEGLPHYRIHRFTTEYSGARRYMRLAMSEMDGWYLQQIVSAPLEDVETAEAQAGEEWRAALRAFVRARQAAHENAG